MRWLFALMLATAAGGAGAASSLALSPARITRLDSLPVEFDPRAAAAQSS